MAVDIGPLPGWCCGSLQPPPRLFWNGTASATAPAVRRWEAINIKGQRCRSFRAYGQF